MKTPHSTLSLPLYQALSRLGRKLEERAGIEEELDRLLPMLDEIPAAGVVKAEREIRGAARLHERRVPVARTLLSDRAPSVRERADFLTRVTAEEI